MHYFFKESIIQNLKFSTVMVLGNLMSQWPPCWPNREMAVFIFLCVSPLQAPPHYMDYSYLEELDAELTREVVLTSVELDVTDLPVLSSGSSSSEDESLDWSSSSEGQSELKECEDTLLHTEISLNPHSDSDSEDMVLFPWQLKSKNEIEEHEYDKEFSSALPYDYLPVGKSLSMIGRIESFVEKYFIIRATAQEEEAVLQKKDAINGAEVVKGPCQRSSTQNVLDIGSLLVLEDGWVLGRVFDTFGPIREPLYAIYRNHRFEEYFEARNDGTLENESSQLESGNKKSTLASANSGSYFIGKRVFYDPECSQFVNIPLLKLKKGCDASNAFDEEVLSSEAEYSDDQVEALSKKQRQYKIVDSEKRTKNTNDPGKKTRGKYSMDKDTPKITASKKIPADFYEYQPLPRPFT